MRKIFLALLVFYYLVGCTTVTTRDRMSVSTIDEKVEIAEKFSEEKIHQLIRDLSRYLNTEGDKLLLRRELVKRHPEWQRTIKELIEEGQIKIGMSKEQILASWGTPDKVNKNVGSWGVIEQWIYEGYISEYGISYYVYVENGVVTSWQREEYL